MNNTNVDIDSPIFTKRFFKVSHHLWLTKQVLTDLDAVKYNLVVKGNTAEYSGYLCFKECRFVSSTLNELKIFSVTDESSAILIVNMYIEAIERFMEQ